MRRVKICEEQQKGNKQKTSVSFYNNGFTWKSANTVFFKGRDKVMAEAIEL